MEALLGGFATTLTLDNLFYCFVGAFLGTVVGILPGLGPLTTIAILLPITFKMDVTSAIIMLSGIYYGVAYGGTVTSVLMRIPGEASSVVTCLDGYEMARKGRAGAALGIVKTRQIDAHALAHRLHRAHGHGRVQRGVEFIHQRHRLPVAAHQLAAGRARANAGDQLILFGFHVELSSS